MDVFSILRIVTLLFYIFIVIIEIREDNLNSALGWSMGILWLLIVIISVESTAGV